MVHHQILGQHELDNQSQPYHAWGLELYGSIIFTFVFTHVGLTN